MDNPVFKLEGVVHERSAEALQDFEGPLDLILFLLSKNKIEIQDIPIALILDQYLAYLEQRKQLDLEVASEFITMAAHLMYIKTRMLLSLEDEQAQSEMDELIASLKERQQKDTYLRIKTLTETLGPMGEFGRSIMTRQPEPMQRGKIYEYSHEKADLVLAMQTIMERGEKLAAPPSAALSEIVRREPYPVKGKAEEILHRLKEFGMTRFKLLFRGSRSRDRGDVHRRFGALPRKGHPSGRFRHGLHRGVRGRRPRPYQSVKSEERYVFGIFGPARGRVGHRGHFVRQRRTASHRPHLPCARFGPSDRGTGIAKARRLLRL